MRDVDVPVAEHGPELAVAAATRLLRRFRVARPPVEDLEPLVRGHVVEYRHPAVADHGYGADLEGIEPGEMRMADDPVLEADGEEHHVVEVIPQERLSGGRDHDRRR